MMSALANKTVLVTGATGFIGGRLAERLVVEHGARVRALVRNFGRAARLARYPIELVNVSNPSGLPSGPPDWISLDGMRKMLHLDVKFGEPGDSADIGAEMGKRVYVRFSHGYEPLAYRFYRELRLLMLRRFDV